jgi:transposase
MLSWEEFVQARNLKERGWSLSAIARHLGKDRKTIRRYLNDPDAVPGQRAPVAGFTHPYGQYLEARLEDNEHVDATVLFRELRALGYEGSYRTLARHLQRVRPACDAAHGETPPEAVRMLHRPGAAQADWSPYFWTPAGATEEIEIQLCSIVLCRPHVLYGEFFARQGWDVLAAGHIRAFDYFGGVPSEIRYDRMSQVFRRGTTRPTAAHADFAAYYGFSLVPIPTGRSRTNGRVERGFSYVTTSFFHTADAATLGELNRQFWRWLDEVANRRTSEDIPVPPQEALEAERAHLLPVRRPPYPLEIVEVRKVDRYCLVRLDGARYSVEPGHVGSDVRVVSSPGSERVEIRRGERVIGSHHRVPRGEISFDPAHGKAIEALTLASLHRAGQHAHRRKRNDGRIGPRAAAEAAILKARLARGTDGVVQGVDLARYDQYWSDR